MSSLTPPTDPSLPTTSPTDPSLPTTSTTAPRMKPPRNRRTTTSAAELFNQVAAQRPSSLTAGARPFSTDAFKENSGEQLFAAIATANADYISDSTPPTPGSPSLSPQTSYAALPTSTPSQYAGPEKRLSGSGGSITTKAGLGNSSSGSIGEVNGDAPKKDTKKMAKDAKKREKEEKRMMRKKMKEDAQEARRKLKEEKKRINAQLKALKKRGSLAVPVRPTPHQQPCLTGRTF